MTTSPASWSSEIICRAFSFSSFKCSYCAIYASNAYSRAMLVLSSFSCRNFTSLSAATSALVLLRFDPTFNRKADVPLDSIENVSLESKGSLIVLTADVSRLLEGCIDLWIHVDFLITQCLVVSLINHALHPLLEVNANLRVKDVDDPL